MIIKYCLFYLPRPMILNCKNNDFFIKFKLTQLFYLWNTNWKGIAKVWTIYNFDLNLSI